MSTQPQYWVVVAARDHALSGIAQGIVQANHGKAAPLRRMQPGDRVVLYAPKLTYGRSEPCQLFVGLGTVADEEVFQAHVAADFQPFRRKVLYQAVQEAPIQPLLEDLSFIQNKTHWGYSFRVGCFGIPANDFERIRQALLA
ncbi:EVE domain-containing protein [Hymenobacter sp. M29]|uniref:UPF0310 protein Q5H92_03475 n=1 Tax=Hymenobacter mellowenesis TaxID=3063995 RepID=A0ABT9A7S0_9BACT|nr:EVE domain-containing protein [Hymenobacter sp. M29]MDO7845404.1 EVE domain-containing protein [Hymenobacter sp. M29]